MSPTAPLLTWRFMRVWKRDWLVNKQSWHIGFLVPLLEPVLYVASFGIGFRLLIPEVHYLGHTVSYVMFTAPALIATSIMYNAFFESGVSMSRKYPLLVGVVANNLSVKRWAGSDGLFHEAVEQQAT